MDDTEVHAPKSWKWELYDLPCADCGAANQLHHLAPAMVKAAEAAGGEWWECAECGTQQRRYAPADGPASGTAASGSGSESGSVVAS